jgi:hypothetical protein
MESNYIIIGGTNKAATTSFFEYLAAHPAICPAFIKQTFFFLDKNMQQDLEVVSLYDYEKGSEQYELFFRNFSKGQLKLEASPEYLYSAGTARRIFDFFQSRGNGILLFILREPVSRFVSLFHFGKQQGVVNIDCSFHDFMLQSMQYTAKTNTSLMAYQTGFYSKFLENYISVFGKERIKIYFYEDLIKDTETFIKQVSHDLCIDASFYDNFEFENNSQTKSVVKNRVLSNAYKRGRRFVMEKSFKSKRGYDSAMFLKKTITPFYRKINLASAKKEEINADDRATLSAAYKDEKEKIRSLFGITVPW